MHDAATASVIWIAATSLLIWLVLLFSRGFFWRVSALQASASMRPVTNCRVVAIIPARDEADVIGEAIRSLQAQDFDGELHITVVDDNSTDGTGDVARATGTNVVKGLPLPAGWTGKLWALQQGITEEADYLLFTDADIRHGKHNVASLVGMAQQRELDLVSHMVKLHCASLAEKLTIPAFVFFFFMLYPPAWIEMPIKKTAGAAGGCVLIRPAMLRRIGGLAAIRGELIDDCSLAAAVKRHGGRLWLGLTTATSSIRPYTGIREIGKMISRSAFRQLNHSTLLLIGTVLGLVMTYLAPMLLGLSGSYLALLTWLIMTLCYVPMVQFYGLNLLWALALPLTACFYLGATLHSAFEYWGGRGGEWKGRIQDRALDPAADVSRRA